jgi:hypothetical protein
LRHWTLEMEEPQLQSVTPILHVVIHSICSEGHCHHLTYMISIVDGMHLFLKSQLRTLLGIRSGNEAIEPLFIIVNP